MSWSKNKNPAKKNVLRKKRWRTGSVQILVEPPQIPLIKSKNYVKSEKDCVKIKLRRDIRSEKLDS